MFQVDPADLELILVEEKIWVLVGEVGLSIYDFAFTEFLACRHPWQRPDRITAIGRFGAVHNYDEVYQKLAAEGILLIHSPEQHLLASELHRWYPLLEGLTPKSLWFSEPPDIEFLQETIGLPLFLKGSRQTSRHRAALSIIRSAEDYARAIEIYQSDPILHWQELVCRELVSLMLKRAAMRPFHHLFCGRIWSIRLLDIVLRPTIRDIAMIVLEFRFLESIRNG
jgi:hypothetical protein